MTEEGLSGEWITVDFHPIPGGGTATVRVDGLDSDASYHLAGWLVQELEVSDPIAGTRQRAWSIGRRVVPGVYAPSANEVVPLDEIRVDRIDGASWLLRGLEGAGAVTVNVEPAPVHVELIDPPKTRKVIRDKHGAVTEVVEKVQR